MIIQEHLDVDDTKKLAKGKHLKKFGSHRYYDTLRAFQQFANENQQIPTDIFASAIQDYQALIKNDAALNIKSAVFLAPALKV